MKSLYTNIGYRCLDKFTIALEELMIVYTEDCWSKYLVERAKRGKSYG